jgi:DNA-directed RNA polymerase alpha subunit
MIENEKPVDEKPDPVLPKYAPIPELPDDTPIGNVRFPTRIRDALNAAGMATVGAVRDMSDAELMSLQDIGPESVSYLRKTLGLPSTEGVTQPDKKPT